MTGRTAAKTPAPTTTPTTTPPQTTTTQPAPVVVAPGSTAAEPATPPAGTPSAAVDPREAALADLINVTPTTAATLTAAAAALAVPVVPTGLVHEWVPAGARFLVRCGKYSRNVTRPDPDSPDDPPRTVTQRLLARRGDIVVLVPDDRTHGHVDLGYLLPAPE